MRTARMSVHRPSPGCMPNCFSAILFHLVAACTTCALMGCLLRSFEMWNPIGVLEPSRSSRSLTPLSSSTISGTSTIIRLSSLQRLSSM